MLASRLLKILVGLTLLQVTISPAVAQERPAIEGDVEIALRAPDGKPLVKHKAIITPLEESPADQHPTQREVTTDEKGIARFSWPMGYQMLQVVCPEVGFGATGMVGVRPQVVARPVLPPLAPFATVEGDVDPSLMSPGLIVRRSTFSRRWREASAACDEKGHFIFRDLVPGQAGFMLPPDVQCSSPRVWLVAGEHRTGLRFSAPSEKHPADTVVFDGLVDTTDNTSTVWAQGTVHDISGKPVQNADVYVIGEYFVSHGTNQEVKSAKTDAAGHYQVRGEGRWGTFRAEVIARVEGSPFAFASVKSSPANTSIPVKQEAPATDLTIPSTGGRLKVVVTKNGKPASRVSVNLRHLDAPGFGVGGPLGSPGGLVDSFISPTTTTDDDGVAEFSNLYLGAYRVTAGENGGGGASCYAIAENVPVLMGDEQTFTMAIYPRKNQVRAQLRSPDGTAVPRNADIACSGRVWNLNQGDEVPGALVWSAFEPGLDPARFSYRDLPMRGGSELTEPIYVVDTTLPASPLLDALSPTVVTMRHRQPGSIRVQIVDRDGKPTPGVAVIQGQFGSPAQAGSSDEKGVVTFESMPSGAYSLLIFAPAVGPLVTDDDPQSIPPESSLENRVCFFEQHVTVQADTQTALIAKPTLVGFFKGRIIPEPGVSPKDYVVGWNSTHANGGLIDHYNPQTREYVYGPAIEGDFRLELYRRSKDDDIPVVVQTKALPGHVVSLDLPWNGPRQAHNYHVDSKLFRDSERGSAPNGLDLTILMPDGKTPAIGARVVTFSPDAVEPDARGSTDALGRADLTGAWRYMTDEPTTQPIGSPTEPVIVACQPGASGPVIASLANHPASMRLVLPKLITTSGKITLDGKPVANLKAQLRVLAAYEGKGKLDSVLSLSPPVQADGTFTLDGLSPGTYRIQAAMDNLWLSSTQTITIIDADPPSVTLDIPRPGMPVHIVLADSSDHPACDQTVTVDRPPGPLTEALWRAEFKTDGAGDLWIIGLETGHHTLHIAGNSQVIDVPELSTDHPAPVEVRQVIK